MAGTEEKEKHYKLNVNNVTMDTLFQSPITINAQKKYANVTNEIRIAADIHAETIKEFKGFYIQSTISNSAHSDSEELVDALSDYEELVEAVSNSEEMVEPVSKSEELFDAVSDPKGDPSSDPKVATYTNNVNYPHKLLANSEIPAIIQVVIPPVHQATTDEVSTSGGDLHAVHTVLLKEIVTGAAPSAAHAFKDPPVVNCNFSSRLIPIDMKTSGVTPSANNQVLIGTGNSTPPIRIRLQYIKSKGVHRP